MSKPMTHQEIFDTAIEGVVSQGEAAKQDRTSTVLQDVTVSGCALRGQNGTKCAIGWCIPDDEYDPAMENLVVADLQDRIPALSEASEYFLLRLQNCHDLAARDHAPSVDFIRAFLFRCENLAEDYSLEMKPAEEYLK